ncbi:hypothetical protein [Pseudoclavibacter caeni]|jgi:hypothetical protein|uniref:Uncharacterized protein n=1 Tax=Pseudoclavibacter caeni TaxID=908846 RepID=A0A7C8FTS9_9MICO|nr:hypothetical protein [Pseudoclavibacter caeni]KAB1633492.1 hypothetical protein F8O02_00700 [Pseudoclavibacter caeni]NYJ96516.1 hypothetical protein [Pseudoclavibacter caeni]
MTLTGTNLVKALIAMVCAALVGLGMVSPATAAENDQSTTKVQLLTSSGALQEAAVHAGVSTEFLAANLVDVVDLQQAREISTQEHAKVLPDSTPSLSCQPSEGQVTTYGWGIHCARAWAGYGLYTIWGTAICGLAAAGSVGALGIPCELLLAAGSGAIDWNSVC